MKTQKNQKNSGVLNIMPSSAVLTYYAVNCVLHSVLPCGFALFEMSLASPVAVKKSDWKKAYVS
jgi:hypothetical protein